MNRLDAISWSVILGLVLAISGVYVVGSQIDLDVQLAGADAQNNLSLGPYGPLQFKFSRAVQPDLLSPHLQLTPAVSGTIRWDDPTQAEFIPDQPFFPGVSYTVRLAAGAIGKSGEKVKTGLAWTFRRRPPLITYLSTSRTGSEIWITSPTGNETPRQITKTKGAVFDYAPSPNGELIAYSVVNAKQGFDLWIIDRDGRENHILLDCGNDRCSSVSWDVHSNQIAFSRQSAGVAPGAPLGAPRPWLLDIKTGESKPLYDDPQAIGYGPIWSPDGQKIASLEGVKGGIQIYDLNSKQNIFFPSQSGTVGNWFPDSQKMVFTDIVNDGTTYKTAVFVADAGTSYVQQIFASQKLAGNFSYDVPAWSPVGDWMAVGVQSQQNIPGNQLWLVSADEQTVRPITRDAKYTIGQYSWNDLGNTLLFQRDLLGAGVQTETLIWHNDGHPARVIAQNAAMPRWLP